MKAKFLTLFKLTLVLSTLAASKRKNPPADPVNIYVTNSQGTCILFSCSFTNYFTTTACSTQAAVRSCSSNLRNLWGTSNCANAPATPVYFNDPNNNSF